MIFHFLAVHGHNFLACLIASFTTGCNQLSRRRLFSVRRTIFFCPSDDLSFVAFDGQNFIRCFTATFTYHRLQ